MLTKLLISRSCTLKACLEIKRIRAKSFQCVCVCYIKIYVLSKTSKDHSISGSDFLSLGTIDMHCSCPRYHSLFTAGTSDTVLSIPFNRLVSLTTRSCLGTAGTSSSKLLLVPLMPLYLYYWYRSWSSVGTACRSHSSS